MQELRCGAILFDLDGVLVDSTPIPKSTATCRTGNRRRTYPNRRKNAVRSACSGSIKSPPLLTTSSGFNAAYTEFRIFIPRFAVPATSTGARRILHILPSSGWWWVVRQVLSGTFRIINLCIIDLSRCGKGSSAEE